MSETLEKITEFKDEFYQDNPTGAYNDCVYYAKMIDDAYKLIKEEGDSVLRTSEAGREWLENYERITQ